MEEVNPNPKASLLSLLQRDKKESKRKRRGSGFTFSSLKRSLRLNGEFLMSERESLLFLKVERREGPLRKE